MKVTFISIALIFAIHVIAQPSTEVYLFDLSNDGLSNPLNISDNEGYDNQPSFWLDGKSVLYARTVNGQTEIARYFLESGKTIVITNTRQGGEYSPTNIPGTQDISSVRLDTTGLQLLYRYNLDGMSEVLVPNLKIGYHAWISQEELVTFVLGTPATMQLINTKTGNVRVLADSIGRSLHKIPNSTAFSFVDKSVEPWAISSMNPETNETKEIVRVLDGSEDYCWTSNGEILMGNGAMIYKMNEKEGWRPFWDLNKNFGIVGSISRMSVSPNLTKLLVVVSN
jgi:hypothetical protein